MIGIMHARRLGLVAMLGGALLFAMPASTVTAQPNIKEAKRHYKEAEKAMKNADYAIAAREYGIAYANAKDPVLFYKIGRAHDLAGNCKSALVYYGRYLKDGKPSAKAKNLTDGYVATCKKKLGTTDTGTGTGTTDTGTGTTDTGTGTTDTGTGTTDTGTGTTDTGTGTTGTGTGAGTTDTGTGTTGTGATGTGTGTGSGTDGPPSFDTKTQRTWKRTAAWVSVGLAMAFVTSGAVLGLSASSREEDLDNLVGFRNSDGTPSTYSGTIQERYEDLKDEGKQLDTFSKISFGIAGAAVVSAAVFFVLDAKSAKKVTTAHNGSKRLLVPVVSTNALGFSAGWEF
jgi:hypothetical protein